MCLRTGIFALYSADVSELFCVTVYILQHAVFAFPVGSIFSLNTCDACFTFQSTAVSRLWFFSLLFGWWLVLCACGFVCILFLFVVFICGLGLREGRCLWFLLVYFLFYFTPDVLCLVSFL